VLARRDRIDWTAATTQSTISATNADQEDATHKMLLAVPGMGTGFRHDVGEHRRSRTSATEESDQPVRASDNHPRQPNRWCRTRQSLDEKLVRWMNRTVAGPYGPVASVSRGC